MAFVARSIAACIAAVTMSSTFTAGHASAAQHLNTGPTPPACTTAQLNLSTKGVDGGMSHSGYQLIFTNKGADCTISGYPTVVALPQGKYPGFTAQQNPLGDLGGLPDGVTKPPSIVVGSGHAVAALIEGTSWDCPAGNAKTWTNFQIKVTPPGNTQPMPQVLDAPNPCHLEVHPLVPFATP
jgi:hypothetical protein